MMSPGGILDKLITKTTTNVIYTTTALWQHDKKSMSYIMTKQYCFQRYAVSSSSICP